MHSRVKLKKQKKRSWKKWILIFGLILLFISGGCIYYVWDKVSSTIETMHNPLVRDKDPERQKELNKILKNTKSINILLLGVDARAGDRGRSDTMILMSLNPKTDRMIMMSIPRDTYVNIPGRGMDKINHAYAFGGTELSINTVEEAFNVPLHFYARVNMEGFQQGVDAIGGVNVNNEFEFSQGGKHFPKGEIHLNGDDALNYIRMRKKDPRGDMGRNDRQRQVIAAAMKKGANVSNITKFGEVFDILGNNVETNMDQDQMQKLFTSYRHTQNNIETLEVKGSGQMMNGVWYYVVPDGEFQQLTKTIKDHMEAK
ncbi:MAG TPA: LCP family protein [Cerasibacillus sp.]|uniref:LCP family glycopolymer transferase n=1 Tax=Cerasibacillus sp. TaxID=2498711 RepID=UPI002F3FE53B